MHLRKFTSSLAVIVIAALACAGESFSMGVSVGAGILPFKIEGAETYFLVGYNGRRRAMNDFGGTVDPSKDSDLMATAAREFNEETMFMFSAGTLPIANLLQMYLDPSLSIPYHGQIKQIIQYAATHQLQKSGPGFNYTLFVVPVIFMDHQPPARDLYTQQAALAQRADPIKLGAEPSDFAWIRKSDLYRALNGTPLGQQPVIPAPTQRNPNRIFPLADTFVGMLRNASTETGSRGLQSVMP